MDSDSPWEENPHTDHIPETEWTKITAEFTNSGYREGIIAGKDAFLQPGFDDGFANVGVPLGRELGNLRGVAVAVLSLLNSQSPDPLELEEIRSISSALSTIRFSDVAPRDLEAEQHAKEHPSSDDHEIVGDARKEKDMAVDVSDLKERLALLCAKLGLPVTR